MKSIVAELKEVNPCAVIGTLPSIINDALKEVTNAIEVPHVLTGKFISICHLQDIPRI